MNRTITRTASTIAVAALTLTLTSCAAWDSLKGDIKGQLVGQSFTISGYDNNGNETLTMHGEKVGLEGNKVKDSSSSDGSTSYSLSSVVTVTIDGDEMESCGDTLVFAEDGLTPVKDYAQEKIDASSKTDDFLDNTLVAKPLNRFKNLFGKRRVIVVKSQLGDPIEAYEGDKVYWDVRDDLPKTTKLEIDGKALYIHRANFQIIDADLLD